VAVNDLGVERTKFNEERVRITTDNDDIKSKLAQSDAKYKNDVAALKDDVAKVEKESKAKDLTIEKQMNRLQEMQTETFEVADGRIAHVDQAGGIVWINLGMADGLRRQVSFSVYDQDQTAVDNAKPKGAVEVIRIIDQHLSEARITAASSRDPILPGDQVFSPAWKPGRKIRFALAGVLDIDGDGNSDRDLVRNLITMNGGVIDAELHDDGNQSGQLTVGTRYLVIGNRPTEEATAEVLRGYNNIISQAQDFGIERM
jgi:hypothetical protein